MDLLHRLAALQGQLYYPLHQGGFAGARPAFDEDAAPALLRPGELSEQRIKPVLGIAPHKPAAGDRFFHEKAPFGGVWRSRPLVPFYAAPVDVAPGSCRVPVRPAGQTVPPGRF